jgi:hypothetical protein
MLMMLARVRSDFLRPILLLLWMPVAIFSFALAAARNRVLFQGDPWRRASVIYMAAMEGLFMEK